MHNRHSLRMLGGAIAAVLAVSHSFAKEFGAYEVTAELDVRAVSVDSPYTSFVNGGLGLSRFDEDHDGLRLGRVFVDLTGPITETIRGNLTLSTTGDRGSRVIDVTEGFVEWRPYPTTTLRWRTKVGAFYPPVSLENRRVGWESPYTISSSAINTWIGEEVRIYGIEQSVTLASSAERPFDLSLMGALYAWNDPMGILIFQRGWAIHDRQTAIWGSLPRPRATNSSEATIEFNKEIDDRVGYYVGADFKAGGHVLRALHYDNRGDPSQRIGKEPAWLSRFDSVGWRYELPTKTTFIAQYLKGDTSVGPSPDRRGMLIGEYWSYFLLTSQQYGAHRFSARYDRLFTKSTRAENLFDSHQTAIAWTLGYSWDIDSTLQLAVEALEIRGARDYRANVGLVAEANERTLQVALRYTW